MKKIVLIYQDRYIERIDEKKADLQEDGSIVYSVQEDDVADLVEQLGVVEKIYFTENVSIENQNIFSRTYNAQKMS